MPLSIEPAFTLTVDLGDMREDGSRVIPITGGTVAGPGLTGEVLPGVTPGNVPVT